MTIFSLKAIYVRTLFSPLGGEHITELLCQLLEAQNSDDLFSFNSQTARRRMQIAQQLKKDYAFVALDFNDSCAQYGREELDPAREMLSKRFHNNSKNVPRNFSYEQRSEEIQCLEEIALSDGNVVSVCLDCERFYCTEVLFSPSVLSSCCGAPGIVDTILDVVQAIPPLNRSRICNAILLTGRSALLEGLSERLQSELFPRLSSLGVLDSKIIIGENPVNVTSSSLWKGVEGLLKLKYSKDLSSSHNNNNNSYHQYKKLLNQNVITLNEYLEHGSSILLRNETI